MLSGLVREVVTIEREKYLYETAKVKLKKLGYTNVTCILGDGTLGFSKAAPYDRIIVTAAAADIPQAYYDQIVEKGIIVMPVCDTWLQTLLEIKKEGSNYIEERHDQCRFVPLISGESLID